MILRSIDKLKRIKESESGCELVKLCSHKITSAQLLAMFATPITVVPAVSDLGGLASVGAAFAWVPQYTVMYKPAGTAYTIGTNSGIALRYTNASGTMLQVVESTGFLDQATAQTRIIQGWQSLETAAGAATGYKAELIPTVGAAIVAMALTAAPTVGTSPLYIEVYGFKVNTLLTY